MKQGSTFLKIKSIWDVAPCSLVGVDRRFRGTYCLHHQSYECFSRNFPTKILFSCLVSPVWRHTTYRNLIWLNIPLGSWYKFADGHTNHDSPWWWRQYAPLKRLSTPRLHGALIFIPTAVRALYLSSTLLFVLQEVCHCVSVCIYVQNDPSAVCSHTPRVCGSVLVSDVFPVYGPTVQTQKLTP
jgi:hypothetical protein